MGRLGSQWARAADGFLRAAARRSDARDGAADGHTWATFGTRERALFALAMHPPRDNGGTRSELGSVGALAKVGGRHSRMVGRCS